MCWVEVLDHTLLDYTLLTTWTTLYLIQGNTLLTSWTTRYLLPICTVAYLNFTFVLCRSNFTYFLDYILPTVYFLDYI